jgi:putative ABC transport system substrate-binding protein
VFAGGMPVELGLVASLAPPDGNITGISNLSGELMPKRFELLSELVPQARVISLLVHPNASRTEDMIEDLQVAARSRRVTVDKGHQEFHHACPQ